MRHSPSPRIAVTIGLLFPPAFVGLVALSGVQYGEIADSTSNLIRAVLVPEAVLAVLLILLTSWLGWWGPLWKEKVTTARWMIALPIVFILTALLTINYSVVSQESVSYLLIAAVATLFVGFNEELVYRGLAVVGLRGGVNEVYVWLFSSLMFALLHAWNVLLGQSVTDTIQQLIFTFLLGSVFYAIRRVTGGLLIPILFDGLWDWAIFTGSGRVLADASDTATGSVGGLFGNIGLMAMLIMFGFGVNSLFQEKPAADSQPT